MAFLLGSLMTLALPPLGVFPVLLLCVPGFIGLARTCETKRQSFLTGWLFGCGYFIFGLYWVSFALFVDIDRWGWVLPLSAIVGPAALALFYGFIPLLARRYNGDKTAHALAFVAAWAGIEWLRGHVLTGFPWNLPGYAWNHVLPVMQVSAHAGIYGLTLLTLLWAALPSYRHDRRLFAGALLLFIVAAGAGMLRLHQNPTAQNGEATVRIVQPNLSQSVKWNDDAQWRNLEHHANMTKDSTATFTVWPETAVTADMTEFPEIARYIARNIPKDGVLVTGSLRVAYDIHGIEKYFNSVSVIDTKANVLGTYDKHHLVPFGEYIPFRRVLNFTPVASSIAGLGDFTPGTGAQTIAAGTLPKFSPLICYEVIFPNAVASRAERPDWLVNVTNDGWYGKTTGPHQHFETVRVRAVEEGLPLARAANTGISGMIDPLGRIIAEKPLGETGTVDAILPAPLPPTLYARRGDSLFFLLLALLAVAAEFNRRRIS